MPKEIDVKLSKSEVIDCIIAVENQIKNLESNSEMKVFRNSGDLEMIKAQDEMFSQLKSLVEKLKKNLGWPL